METRGKNQNPALRTSKRRAKGLSHEKNVSRAVRIWNARLAELNGDSPPDALYLRNGIDWLRQSYEKKSGVMS